MPLIPRITAVAVIGLALLVGCTDGSDDPAPLGTGTPSPAGTDRDPAAEVTTTDEASELVLGLYEEQAVDRALDLVAEGSIPPEIADDVRGSFETILARTGIEVGATFEHDVDGVRIIEVDTSDGIRWCVRPDGHLLLQCRVGIAPVEVDTGDTPITVHRAEMDVFPEEQQLRIQLRTEEEFTFEGLLSLRHADGEPAEVIQVQGALASQGEQVADVGRDTQIVPGTTLLMAWVTDVGASLGTDLVLAFGNGSFDVIVQPTQYFVR